MKLIFTFTLVTILFSGDTFSIVAVDPATNEVGSAGASCIGGSIIISDVHPGIGAIHTQSYWNPTNQDNAQDLMAQGNSPETIINWLVQNDAQNNPGIRQYGAVDLVDGGRSAAFTGENCMDYKNHILGPTYAIQGNILLGQDILDNMEANFVNSAGALSDRLMEALQGANVPGADTRCLDEGVSSLSSFIRLAKAENDSDSLFLHLNVNYLNNGTDPLDSLQSKYNNWIMATMPPGDVNHEGQVNILDLVFVVNIILEFFTPTQSQTLSADIDQTGSIDVIDLVVISAIILS